MKNLLFIILTIFISGNLFAQSTPEEMFDTFFEEYKEDPNKAIDYIFSKNTWILESEDTSEIKNLLNKLTVDFVGNYIGYDLMVEKVISGRFVLLSYLVRYDRQPFRFTFQFYKPDNEWMFFKFLLDDELFQEIEKSAELYFLDLD